MKEKVVAVFLLVLVSITASASTKDLAIAITGGFPELMSAQASYRGLSGFAFGVGLGSLPVNSIINSQIVLSPVPVALSSGGPFNLYPSATYSLTNFSVFARWLPWKSGFFTQVGYSFMNAGGAVTGGLRNESTGGIVPGAISGSLRITQPVAAATVGWELITSGGFLFHCGLGLSYLVNPSHTLDIGGNAAVIAPLDPSAEEAFEDANQTITQQVNDAMASYKQMLRFVPSVFIGLGWAFDL